MKAINAIPALFFSIMFVFTFVSASAEGTSKETASDVVTLNAGILAPTTPAEATFEDVDITTINFASLAPVTPTVADFSDATPASEIDIAGLAPLTPAEADFNDGANVMVDIAGLAFVAPTVADFE